MGELAAAGLDPWALAVAWLTWWLVAVIYGLECARPLLTAVVLWLGR